MKQLLLFSIILLLLSACKKDNAAAVRNQITGSWEYVTFSGYPFNGVRLPAGNGRIIVIGKDGSFERFSHDTLIFKGRYSLKERKDCYGDDKQVFFTTTDSSFVIDDYVTVDNGQLFFNSSNCLQDGGSSIWRKL
ncbi:MAG: hypothetical protein QM726_14295 [Chitinophagaceae bacterium]